MVHDVELGAEQIGDLIVALSLDRLLQRYEIWPKLAKAIDENRPAVVPGSAQSPEVERRYAQAIRVRRASRYAGNGRAAILAQRGRATPTACHDHPKPPLDALELFELGPELLFIFEELGEA